MKKNILVLGVFSLVLFSCDNASGGNKSILPADLSTQTETDSSAAHTNQEEIVKPADSVKTEIPVSPEASKPTDSTEAKKINK